MNENLTDINKLITLCDKMYDNAKDIGYIKARNEYYDEYHVLVKDFCRKHKLDNDHYAPYAILNKYWTNVGSNIIYLSEIDIIKRMLILIKHSKFGQYYEKIFISHREKDKEQVDCFIELLYAMGIERRTNNSPESMIFCTSHPEGYIKNGERNLDEIRNMLNTDKHVFYILWYTDNYFESNACMNEAGAVWAMNKKYQEILVPNFDSEKIKGLLDKQPVWFKANDKSRLNTFKEQIEEMFSLTPIAPNSWEHARDKFIEKAESF